MNKNKKTKIIPITKVPKKEKKRLNTGYHIKEIKRGVIGEFSKIEEEFDELKDAKIQEDNSTNCITHRYFGSN